MFPFRGLILRARALIARARADRELDDEIRLHLELETEKNIRAGLAPAEARRRALVAFGGVEATRDAQRDARGVRWIEDVLADARYAVRTLRRSPVLAGAAVVTLALAVGANTAIFSAVNAVILRPLPFPAPGRLMAMWETNPEKGWTRAQVAPANMLDWQERVAAFQDVAAFVDYPTTTTLTGDGDPTLLRSAEVTGNFFDVLGVRAAVGRTFVPAETWDTGARVAVIGDGLWRNRFGGDPAVIGRTVELSGRAVEIVGVLPARFGLPNEDVSVWFPVGWDPDFRSQVFFRRAHWLRAIARLRPDVSAEAARAQLEAVMRQLEREYPETNRVMGAGMEPLHDFLVGDTRRPLVVLLGAVGLLLLIACANVGNLLLVRAAGREREAALRLALGARRGRLVRQALTESLVLAAAGGAAGLLLGWWGTRALGALQPAGLLPVREVGVGWTVLWYVIAISTASALLFGAAPAVWSGRRLPGEILKEGGRTGTAARRVRRWGKTLVVAEVALAMPLAVSAGLLVRSFWQLQRVDPGIDPDGVLAVEVELPGARYETSEAIVTFFDELVGRAGAVPGVEMAAATSALPMTVSSWSSGFTAEGWRAGQFASNVLHREITPSYFALMRVPLLQGRRFTPADRAGQTPVTIINETLARRYFPGEDPVGRRVTFDQVPDSTSFWRTIVGVVGDEHQTRLAEEPQAEFYAPLAQDQRTRLFLTLRTANDPAELAAPARRLVAELDPALAITSTRTMNAVRAESLARERFLMTALSVFAAVGVLLAIVGVYGVMAHLARGRTQEMGIRIALGARATHVQWMVVRHGLVLVAAGLAVGVAVAAVATGTMRALLYGVQPADPLTFLVVPGVLVMTGLLAAWVPAIRASRADPVGALRAE